MTEARGGSDDRGTETATENPDNARRAQRAGETAQRQTEQLAAEAREGVRRAGAATAAGADAALRSGTALTQGVQDITTAWAHYAEAVVRQTSEASRALMNCRSFPEMLEVQARLLHGNLQAFLDQSTKIADIAGRMAARPFEAVKQASADQALR